jgi:NADH:ubiquinone oxidoreductase subunit 5 (subunit L)/multisubunit Na+/H+ antiporter MnhA subunit
MLVGWDGLGLTSFVLINYYKAKSSFAASFKTYLINRLGDGLILSSLGMLILSSFKYLKLKSFLFLMILILGLYTKRAHLPFGR